ncbi:uncharacterized protein PV09_07282 [Verruconis gallopava]|uniref:Uncharacterized protein n=1 Tax=Verruconis gallopava TaxID=253628 RepID=A0A0D2APZ5_9PEZI|nr:uncharacterized protein PV09_07282 [Verruconis gallopava]KIW01239.1 hypothetical protein PV09_07282 [Verruconis gallopava]
MGSVTPDMRLPSDTKTSTSTASTTTTPTTSAPATTRVHLSHHLQQQQHLPTQSEIPVLAHDDENDHLPPARPVPVLSASSARNNLAKPSDQHQHSRPRTAPSQSKSRDNNSSNNAAFEPPIPKIAIFADALSLKKLREQYQTIRKSPTLPDLSQPNDNLKRPQSRRVYSATPNLASPRLPETDVDSKTSSSSKRAPASRSSNGVDTGKGPPPALVTRSSSYTGFDPARRAQSPAAAAFAQQRQKPYSLRPLATETSRPSSDSFDLQSPRDRQSSDFFSPLSPGVATSGFESSLEAIMDQQSTYSDAQEYLEDRTSKYTGGLSTGQGVSSGAGTEASGRSTEDLFLNEAQDGPSPTGTQDMSTGHLERPLSGRGRSNPQRTSLPVSSKSRRDSMGSLESGARSMLPATERSYVGQRRASVNSTPPSMNSSLRNPTSLSADSRFNSSMYRSRYAASNTTPQHSSRRPSVPGDTASVYSRPSLYRPSKLNQYSTRDFDSISMADSPLEHRAFALRAEHNDEAESVVSGMQSEMLARLQELDKRMRRMEQEKLVSTGSNGSNERPKTATTATTPLTTMSSSPRNQFKTGRSPQDSVIGAPAAATAYPVLHQTLERCRSVLSTEVYRALELVTSDALELALLTGNSGAGGGAPGSNSVVNGGFTSERQLRRKADNVVRSLQDLCVELCKLDTSERAAPSSRPGTSSGRPVSVHDAPPLSVTNRSSLVRAQSRASSVEPSTAATSDTTRVVSSRALDRIEARRASMNMGVSNSPREASEGFNRNSIQLSTSVETTPTSQQQTGTISKLPRSGTSLLRSRRAQTEEPEEESSPRPISRAATEIGTLRKRQNRLSGSHLQRTSREYTSNVPLPNSSPVGATTMPATATTVSTPPTSSSLRRITGTSLRNESPRSASFASSLLREPRRAITMLEKSPEPESPATPTTPVTPGKTTSAGVGEEDSNASGGNRRLLRRSLGLYTSGARASLGLGLGKRAERRTVVAGASGE